MPLHSFYSLHQCFLLLLLVAFETLASPLALIPTDSSSLIPSKVLLNHSNVIPHCIHGKPPPYFSEDCRYALLSFVNERMSLAPTPTGQQIYYDFGDIFPFLPPPIIQPNYPQIRLPIRWPSGACTMLIDESAPGLHALLTEAEFYALGGSLWTGCIKEGMNIIGWITDALKVSMVVRSGPTLGEERVNKTTPVVGAVAVD